MRFTTRSANIFLSALFIFSLESAAMLGRVSSRIAPRVVSRHFSTQNGRIWLGMDDSAELLRRLKEHPDIKSTSDMERLLRSPTNISDLIKAYFWATQVGNDPLASRIVTAALKVDFKIDDYTGDEKAFTLLEQALNSKRYSLAENLLQNFHANPNSPSHLQCSNGHQRLWAKFIDDPEALELLIKYGVDNLHSDLWAGSLLVRILIRASDRSARSENYVRLIDLFYTKNYKINESDKSYIKEYSDFIESHGWARLLEEAGKKWEAGEKEILESIFLYRSKQLGIQDFFATLKQQEIQEKE